MDKIKETFDKQKLNQRIVTKLNFDVIDYSGFYNSIKELDQYRVCGNCKHFDEEPNWFGCNNGQSLFYGKTQDCVDTRRLITECGCQKFQDKEDK
jgi:hypothetical protein